MQSIHIRPLLIAHRGTGERVTENTMEAFEEAIAHGADSIETDVRKTADEQLICFHNRKWKRRPVHLLTYQELADETSMFGWKPPRLSEVLEEFHGRVHLNLELKGRGLETDVAEQVKRTGMQDHVLVSSFHERSLRHLKQTVPDIPTGLIIGRSLYQNKFQLQNYIQDVFPERRLKRIGADVVCPHYRLLRMKFVQRMNALEIPVHVWTVNDLYRMKKLAKKGVDGIITDRVADAVDMFDEWSVEGIE
ncbi:glycerophosphodiester phosphodiesterase [Salsuginibacillus halophilus]|nr:glycerophosphodiester phosphodiesterase [Salsuginibacillus halophilus]